MNSKPSLICFITLLLSLFLFFPSFVQAKTVDDCTNMIKTDWQGALRCCRELGGKIVKVDEERECQLVGCCVFMDKDLGKKGSGGCAEDVTKEECKNKAAPFTGGENLHFCESCGTCTGEKYKDGEVCWFSGVKNCLNLGEVSEKYCKLKQHPVRIQIGLPTTGETPPKVDEVETGPHIVAGVPDYIIRLYVWLLRAIGAIAVVVIMVAGIMWMTAAGNERIISNARERIVAAIIGLVLASFSYFILYVINPDLVQLKMPGIVRPRKVEQITRGELIVKSTEVYLYKPKKVVTCSYDINSYSSDGPFQYDIIGVNKCAEVSGKIKIELEELGENFYIPQHPYIFNVFGAITDTGDKGTCEGNTHGYSLTQKIKIDEPISKSGIIEIGPIRLMDDLAETDVGEPDVAVDECDNDGSNVGCCTRTLIVTVGASVDETGFWKFVDCKKEKCYTLPDQKKEKKIYLYSNLP